jgi:hypothetical protein
VWFPITVASGSIKWIGDYKTDAAATRVLAGARAASESRCPRESGYSYSSFKVSNRRLLCAEGVANDENPNGR